MNQSIRQSIITYRWIIGFFLWFVLTALQIHGSSIGLYAHLLGMPDLDTAIIGLNRTAQIDEWGQFTPLIFSQYFNGFSYFSEIVRASSTDVSLVYGLPCWDIITFFRPFLWGYLFFTPATGLAYFWMGRLIILFLVSYEMGILLLEKHKTLAFTYACMIAFSQMVQFWFAENAFVELLIFGQGGLVLLDKVGNMHFSVKIFGMVLGIAYCMTAYFFVMYPAWQIAFGYVFALLAGWIICKRTYWQYCNLKSIGCIIFIGIVVLLPIVHVMQLSEPAIQLITNSVYPGQRFITGGSLHVVELFRYGFDYVLPAMYFFQYSPLDTTSFLSFFPLGIVLSLFTYYKTRHLDGLIMSMLILSVIFYSFCLISWGPFLAKITLLSTVPEVRLLPVIDFLQLIVFFRALALDVPIVSRKVAVVITILYVIMISLALGLLLTNSKWDLCLWVIGMISFTVSLCILRYRRCIIGVLLVISVITGLTINPIAQGTNSIYGTELARQIQRITAVDQGKWIVDSESKGDSVAYFLFNNYPLFFGAPTINSSNMYVDWSRWNRFRLTSEQRNVLNRSCYMNVNITDGPTEFICPNADLLVANIVNVKLNAHDLSRLDVSYILSNRDLTVLSDAYVHFENYAQANNYIIYRVQYQ